MNSLNGKESREQLYKYHRHLEEQELFRTNIENKQALYNNNIDVRSRRPLEELAAFSSTRKAEEEQQQNDHNRYLLSTTTNNNNNNKQNQNHDHTDNNRRRLQEEKVAQDQNRYSLDYKNIKTSSGKLNLSENIKFDKRIEKKNKKRNNNINGIAANNTSSSSLDEEDEEEEDCREFSIVYYENGVKTVANSEEVVLVANKTKRVEKFSNKNGKLKKIANNQKTDSSSNMLSGNRFTTNANGLSGRATATSLSFECSTNGSMKSVCDSNSSSSSSGFSSVATSNETAIRTNQNTSTQAINNSYLPQARGRHQCKQDNGSNELTRKTSLLLASSETLPIQANKRLIRTNNNISAAPESRFNSGTRQEQANGQRSKVIDHFDRLLLTEAASRRQQTNNSPSSPTESYISNAESTTLTRGHEFDYSTLCRDEFSSFISGHLELVADLDKYNADEQKQNKSIRNNKKQSDINRHYPRETIKLNDCHTAEYQINTSKSKKKSKRTTKKVSTKISRSGPMLVGVHDSHASPPMQRHEDEQHVDEEEEEKIYSTLLAQSSETSPTSDAANGDDEEEEDLYEVQETFTSPVSSCLSTPTTTTTNSGHIYDDQPSSIDQELVLINESAKINNDNNSDRQHSPTLTSEMLMTERQLKENYKLTDSLFESYLDRIEALIRLTRGDKSISMKQAFGDSCDDLSKFIVSDEFKTEIDYSACEQKNPNDLKIIQEIESQEEDYYFENKIVQIERNIIEKNFLTILSAPQTSAKLNWDYCSENNEHKKLAKIEELKLLKRSKTYLEESLMKRFDKSNLSSSSSSIKSVIERHVSEFIDNYISYQLKLIESSSMPNDWRQNWLFSSKSSLASERELVANNDDLLPKRAKMSIFDDYKSADLIRYSTLLLANRDKDKLKPSIDYIIDENNYVRDDNSEYFRHVNKLYEAEEDRLKELYDGALKLSCQADACRMLLNDEYDFENIQNSNNKQALLTIDYDTTSHYNVNHSYMSFSAYGYLFQCFDRKLKNLLSNTRKNSRRRIEEKLLEKLHDLTLIKEINKLDLIQDNLIAQNRFDEERVKFLIEMTNVELINNLKIIQFCTKISGTLPIIVKWFKVIKNDSNSNNDLLIELSDTTSGQNRIRLRESLPISRSTSSSRNSNKCWPLEMQANYDYEYKNNNLSWFRFKRVQGDILFEIREASLEFDYNQTYKCVIENYCSKEECCFTLRKRKSLNHTTPPAKRSINLANNNKPILRTWSMRTLHKPKPSTNCPPLLPDSADLSKKEEEEIRLPNTNNGPAKSYLNSNEAGNDSTNSLRQTVGSRSAQLAQYEINTSDKFGKDFPYHPENLLKRLEENKFSSLRFKTLSRIVSSSSSSSSGEKNQTHSRSQRQENSPTTGNKQQFKFETTSSWQNNMIQSNDLFGQKEEHDFGAKDVDFDNDKSGQQTSNWSDVAKTSCQIQEAVGGLLLESACFKKAQTEAKQESDNCSANNVNQIIQPRPRLNRSLIETPLESIGAANELSRITDLAESRKHATSLQTESKRVIMKQQAGSGDNSIGTNQSNNNEHNEEVIMPIRRKKVNVNSYQSTGLESITNKNNAKLIDVETRNTTNLDKGKSDSGQQQVLRSNVKSLISRFNLA